MMPVRLNVEARSLYWLCEVQFGFSSGRIFHTTFSTWMHGPEKARTPFVPVMTLDSKCHSPSGICCLSSYLGVGGSEMNEISLHFICVLIHMHSKVFIYGLQMFRKFQSTEAPLSTFNLITSL